MYPTNKLENFAHLNLVEYMLFRQGALKGYIMHDKARAFVQAQPSQIYVCGACLIAQPIWEIVKFTTLVGSVLIEKITQA